MPVLMAISLSRVFLCSLHLSTASSTLPLPEGDEIPLISNHSTTSICVQRTGHSPGQAVMVVLLGLSFDGHPKVTGSEVGPDSHVAAHRCTTPPPPTPASRSQLVVLLNDSGIGERAQEAVEEMADGGRQGRWFHCLRIKDARTSFGKSVIIYSIIFVISH